MNGLDLQRQIHARGLTIPVIFVSASSDDSTRKSAMDQGAFAYLAKPVGDELIRQIRSALGTD
jgi:CheY-like chemotaxis protein